MESHTILWDKCLQIIRDNVSEIAFHTWFDPIVPIQYNRPDFTIQVPSQFFYEYLEEKYADLIHATITRLTGEDIHLKYRIIVDNTSGNAGKTTLEGGRPSITEKNKAVDKLNQSPNDLVQNSVQDWNSNLNPRYTFNNFFEGNSNRVLRTIGDTIAQCPDKNIFNPLFIYGASGVGKTHLCHAIGNKITELYPQKKVIYISSHLFLVQFTDASRKNITNDFINFYQGLDVLIIDDIHELAGKTATLNTYFHIFNHLHLLGKRIILTADKAPKDIAGLEERLITRFSSGMTDELLKPNLELRHQILSNKIKQDGLNISEDIISFIAENVCDHVRDLEGVITSLVAHSLVYNKDVDMALAQEVVSKIVKLEKKVITLDKIQDVVCRSCKINWNDIQSASRKKEIAQARQIVMFLAKKYTDYSFAHIGQLVGKRNHATVLHACNTVRDTMEVDKGFRSTMSDIESMLKQ
ncbi:chromosomal replication initiator protein DnaA [Bacteroidales bacterium OttesenSCG-928-I14]|nr:chromosomal replication initiator protein DnaA [Bacteroidales bacterium OttesenSCG-928-I14]